MIAIIDLKKELGGKTMNKISLKDIFIVSLYSSLVAFGGGYITIPVLEKEYYKKRNAISLDELQDVASIAQSAPGSISVSLATGVGYSMRGIPGAITAFVATLIPPLIIIILVAINYQSFIENPIVKSVFSGLELGVVVIMLKLIKDMLVALVTRDSKLSLFLALFSIFVVLVLKFPLVLILLMNFLVLQYLDSKEESLRD